MQSQSRSRRAAKLEENPREEGGYGTCEKTGTILEGHQYSPMILGDVVIGMERGNRFNEGTVTWVQNLNFNASHVLTYTDHVQDGNTTGPTDSKSKPKWTRVVRMDSGPVQTNKECQDSLLGKRGIKHVVVSEGEQGAMEGTAK